MNVIAERWRFLKITPGLCIGNIQTKGKIASLLGLLECHIS